MFFGSFIALESPVFFIYPRAECSREYSQEVILDAGKAFFELDGWLGYTHDYCKITLLGAHSLFSSSNLDMISLICFMFPFCINSTIYLFSVPLHMFLVLSLLDFWQSWCDFERQLKLDILVFSFAVCWRKERYRLGHSHMDN